MARRIGGAHPDAVVIGCDSMLHIDGELVGKPGDVEQAAQALAGHGGPARRAASPGTPCCGSPTARSTGSPRGTRSPTVRFAEPTDAELEAYLATGEPLAVAGAFTLDGLGGWFVDGIDGDPSNVIGISLPLTRRLLAGVGRSTGHRSVAA